MSDVDIYSPRFMMEALRQIHPVRKFFRNTFFRNVKQHTTKTIELDLYKGKRRIAAYVSPLSDGRSVERLGFDTHETKPGYTKEKVPLTVQDTMNRAFGENIYAASTPQQRAVQILTDDLAMLNERLERREEYMCAEAIITGKVNVVGDGLNFVVDFGYEDGKNKITLSGTDCWDRDGDPMKDIDAWRQEIIKRCGIAPDYCILGSKVGWAITDNQAVKDRLTNTINQQFGYIAPENLPEGVSNLGVLQLPHGTVRLMTYDEWYTDPKLSPNDPDAADSSKDIPLVPEDAVILGSSAARASFNYGLIQNFKAGLVALPRFPYSWEDDDGKARWVQLESAPMPNLYQVDAWMVARVLADA